MDIPLEPSSPKPAKDRRKKSAAPSPAESAELLLPPPLGPDVVRGFPGFARWFEGSKVVDASGNPLVVHHGTEEDFREFSLERSRHFGIHVGTAEQASSMGERVLELYAAIKNPLRLSDLGTWHYQSIIREARRAGVQITEAEYDHVFNQRDEDAATRDLLLAKGFDGIVYANEVEGVGDSYIAFLPQQLKSPRNRTFDPKSPDIYR